MFRSSITLNDGEFLYCECADIYVVLVRQAQTFDFYDCLETYHINKQRAEFSPTYSELPPREIFVEALNQSENVRVATTTTSESERSLQFPTARRVANDPKTKIFTFEGLTPVSTVDDAREDTILVGTSPENETRVVVNDNFIVCSPISSDLSKDQMDENDNNYEESEQIVSVASTVREKVAAWERQIGTWRSSDMYDVPFDEDPMRKNVHVGEFETPIETITEIPMDDVLDDVIECGNNDNTHIDLTAEASTPNTCKMTESDQAAIALTQPMASMTNLLDEEEEPEMMIHSVPSDELTISADNEANEDRNLGQEESMGNELQSKALTTNLVETFGCPDAFCTQVSKLWQS
jgi:hypothetical protein